VTRVAARAAGRPAAGQLTAGAPADMVIWATEHAGMIPYHYGVNLVSSVFVAGRRVR
jgi:imidazolonepropionase-like amidohydrolase